jgi:hypothetical protein
MENDALVDNDYRIHLGLFNQTNELVTRHERIALTIALYTAENPPRFIDMNTAGNKILKQGGDLELVDGKCEAQRLQIREVSSHYQHGWIFLMVYPKNSLFPTNGDTSMLKIDEKKIMPLILEKVVVKAKKRIRHRIPSETKQHGPDGFETPENPLQKMQESS